MEFHTRKYREYIHITPQVEAIVKKSGIKEGMFLVSAMHITAGVYVNDNQSGLIEDINQWLERLCRFARTISATTQVDSHLRALLIHHDVIVPIADSETLCPLW
jgi:secondary thiamine-phosphate synthase enzyme